MSAKRPKNIEPLQLDYTTGISTVHYIPIKLFGLMKDDPEYLDTKLTIFNMDMYKGVTPQHMLCKNFDKLFDNSYVNPELLTVIPIEDTNIQKILEGNVNYYSFIYGYINTIILLTNLETNVFTYYLDTGIDGLETDTARVYIVEDICNTEVTDRKGEVIYCKTLKNLQPNVIEYLVYLFKLLNRKYDLYSLNHMLADRDLEQIKSSIDMCY